MLTPCSCALATVSPAATITLQYALTLLEAVVLSNSSLPSALPDEVQDHIRQMQIEPRRAQVAIAEAQSRLSPPHRK